MLPPQATPAINGLDRLDRDIYYGHEITDPLYYDFFEYELLDDELRADPDPGDRLEAIARESGHSLEFVASIYDVIRSEQWISARGSIAAEEALAAGLDRKRHFDSAIEARMRNRTGFPARST